MIENIYKKLIVKELNGETSQEESLKINQWINESPEHQKIYEELWLAFQLASPDVDLIVPDKETAWTNIEQKITLPQKRRSVFIQLSKIAAAAVIFFMIGMGTQFYLTDKFPSDFLNQYSKVVVPKGQKSMIVLPDGSSVWLNSGSELKYKSSFNSQIRDVELDGEAFFEVKKDNSRMFRVNTGAVSVEVYGTAFNVKNYKEEKKLEVTVETGNVGVIGNGNKLAELTKGKQVSINKVTGIALFNTADVEIVTAWKNNELVFDGTPFEEVIRYLERWYGVNITIEEQMKKKHNYTFKVKTESFRELLELLKEITPLQYKIDGKNVTIRYA
jgi:ferric-dicitrate binding protein FerR (iron transport regulator)